MLYEDKYLFQVFKDVRKQEEKKMNECNKQIIKQQMRAESDIDPSS